MRRRMQAKLKELKVELRRRMHQALPEQGAYLRSVVAGHVRYYGVPLNGWAIVAFRREVGRLPPARVCHPYPWARFDVITQGRSPVR